MKNVLNNTLGQTILSFAVIIQYNTLQYNSNFNARRRCGITERKRARLDALNKWCEENQLYVNENKLNIAHFR